MTITKGAFGGGAKKNGEKKPGSPGKEETVDYVEKPEDGVASKFFGIKSYLHQFYDIGKSSKLGSPTDTEAMYLLSSAPQRRVVYTCRAALIIGMGLLIVGAIAIIVAHLWPKPEATVESLTDPKYLYMSQEARNTNQTLTVWKMVGLVIFAFGGLIIAISLLIPLCCRMKWEEATGRDSGTEPIKIYPTISDETTDTTQAYLPINQGKYGSSGKIDSPIQKKVPASEALEKVQPENGESLVKLSEDALLIGD